MKLELKETKTMEENGFSFKAIDGQISADSIMLSLKKRARAYLSKDANRYIIIKAVGDKLACVSYIRGESLLNPTVKAEGKAKTLVRTFMDLCRLDLFERAAVTLALSAGGAEFGLSGIDKTLVSEMQKQGIEFCFLGMDKNEVKLMGYKSENDQNPIELPLWDVIEAQIPVAMKAAKIETGKEPEE